MFSEQDVIDLVSKEIGVSETHMTLSIMPSTSLGKFQDNHLVNESILSDGNFAMITIDESVYEPNHYEFISPPNVNYSSAIDFIMLMSVKDDVRSRIPNQISNSKKAKAPIVEIPKLGF